MTFIKGLTNNVDIMAKSKCSCDDVEQESCDVATGSGSKVTGNVDVQSKVGDGK